VEQTQTQNGHFFVVNVGVAVLFFTGKQKRIIYLVGVVDSVDGIALSPFVVGGDGPHHHVVVCGQMGSKEDRLPSAHHNCAVECRLQNAKRPVEKGFLQHKIKHF